METIWDHHPTDEELKLLAISRDDPYYLQRADQDAHYVKIAGLVGLRGGGVDEQRAYLDKIQNESLKRTWILALYEIGD
uniref:Uncharacterized protein n=1 Tax=Desulfatirhabdium butyrativorans TaxID=340467 RepID=A0A7C4RQ66_9BACT